ncbi:DUF4128 domain-containing protein [Halomonas sp. McH1-25]|uniref:phage tail terminator-like protein n=1 Tax=unclassified Halomonas TaxID=2609666 RepID=UPI001EF6F3BF|nr:MULTISPECIES: phage tail terminator-like protein [unclassified Halomonas]MCG7598882.1 DUF4128 domain-containing protein [Halomonas sp. McH1-25]MCP1340845.1 DUF4128 domain-containing protein [Halomonas sp. FL8]MCP1361272.1 DUF4128 domain-containing protein [Halomonas sp. BBD45]MCP1363701.1 DUF4128 domain-containing protein [Halomonas sp. BBD48]
MNNTTIRTELVTRLTQWAEHPIQFYGYPDDGDVETAKANGNPWVTCILRPAPAANTSIGSGPQPRRPGVLMLQVFVKPKSFGELEAGASPESLESLGIADSLTAHMENRRLNGVVTDAANVIVVGEQDGWWQLNVNIPYRTTI